MFVDNHLVLLNLQIWVNALLEHLEIWLDFWTDGKSTEYAKEIVANNSSIC